jgi:hypothetical protein
VGPEQMKRTWPMLGLAMENGHPFVRFYCGT